MQCRVKMFDQKAGCTYSFGIHTIIFVQGSCGGKNKCVVWGCGGMWANKKTGHNSCFVFKVSGTQIASPHTAHLVLSGLPVLK